MPSPHSRIGEARPLVLQYTCKAGSGVSDRGGPVGRTNIVLDEELIKQAMRVSGAKTKREAVDWALREMVARGSVYRALRKLRGKLPWEGDVRSWRRGRR